MSQTNPYDAPESNLNPNLPTHATNPNWEIGAVLSEGWALSNGFKGSFWGAMLIYIAIFIGFAAVAFILGIAGGENASVLITLLLLVLQLGQLLIAAPLLAGMMMLGVKRASGMPVNATMLFNYFPKTIPLLLAYLLVGVLVLVGFILLAIPGIYLAFAYALALPLLADKKLGIWEALETSRKGLTACWFRFFFFCILGFIIIAISAIPLGIGLIWTLPWMYASMGVIYRNIFGASTN